MQTQAAHKLGFWRKVAFGMGDIYGGGAPESEGIRRETEDLKHLLVGKGK